MKLSLTLFVLCVSGATASAVKSSKECMWHDFIRHDNISAWEFQAQPHRHMIRDRDKAIKHVEKILQDLTDDPKSGMQFIPNSRWMALFKETSFQLTTRHGHPLHRDPDDKHAQPFPWKGIGYLRLRNYQVLTPAGAYVPAAMSGMADLTFKMKKVDPDVGPGELQLPRTVGEAKITAKVENDMHCDHGRATMSPLFRPVSQTLNISKIANVKQYFPNLAEVTMLDENEVLPFMHEVYRAKIVWTVVYNGVVGEANLVIKYNTSFQDAVAGASPKNGELSLRIRREVAEATGTTGEEGKRKLYRALDVIGDAMQAFRDAGWDGKTPSLPGKNSKGGGKSDKPCDSKGCKDSCHCHGKDKKAPSSNKCSCKGCDCKHCSCKGCAGKDSSCDSSNKCSCKHNGCKCCGCKHTAAETGDIRQQYQDSTPSWLQGWWAAATWLPKAATTPATTSNSRQGRLTARQQMMVVGSAGTDKQDHAHQPAEKQAQQKGGLDDYYDADDDFLPDSVLTEELVSAEVDLHETDVQLDVAYDVDVDAGNDVVDKYEEDSPLYDAEVDEWDRLVVDDAVAVS